ncbi:hypothetical protein AGLY_016981 [Aphis glycines]|uniref:C2H2-type domain-containing protein n=1 Tax=Aphis glycines TaxID=307491 RepID=A0A6G0SWU0_APHGL|nr:hypothetical protein AGLY_016981 [Aphis glycines]
MKVDVGPSEAVSDTILKQVNPPIESENKMVIPTSDIESDSVDFTPTIVKLLGRFPLLKLVEKIIHESGKINTEKTTIKCPYCEATFTLKKNMYAHCCNIHKIEHLSKRPKMSQCHICDVKFVNKKEHLCVKLNITVELEEIIFENLKEFETWKQKLDKETVLMYVLDTGVKKLFNGILKQYYFCHRLLNYRISANDLR